VAVGDCALLTLAVGLAIEDEFLGNGLEPSMATDGASSGSAMRARHPISSRSDVTIVAAARCRST
jgi:hypothetical protein